MCQVKRRNITLFLYKGIYIFIVNKLNKLAELKVFVMRFRLGRQIYLCDVRKKRASYHGKPSICAVVFLRTRTYLNYYDNAQKI